MTVTILLTLFVGIFVIFLIISYVDKARLRRLAADRNGDSICRFARSLDYRRLDTRVIRAVYEGIQEYFRFVCPAFPIRVTDDLVHDLRMDHEDFLDLVTAIADRCGRGLDDWERNPHYPGCTTVSGLVAFLCAQPRIREV